MSNQPLILCVALLLATCADLAAASAISWEQHPEGIATAMDLSSSTHNGIRKSLLTLRLKNTTGAITYWDDIQVICKGDYFIDIGFVPTYVNYLTSPDYVGPPIQWPKPKQGIDINPGATVSEKIDISAKQLLLIRGNPVKCRISFVNTENGKIVKNYSVETTPAILVPAL